jgi:dTDP-4-amino-4,6-dideoxygalactose transaminase
LRQIRNQGLTTASLLERHSRLGGNFKFTDLQAAVALSQLDALPARVQRQKRILEMYRAGLGNLSAFRCLDVATDDGEVPLRPEFLCSERDRFVADMAAEGIEVMPNSPNLSEYGHIGNFRALPSSEIFTNHMVTLPGGPDQSLEDIRRTIDVIHRVAIDYRPLEPALVQR